ncbi:MAG: NUDIX domain-containing protein [Niabella sp.]
MTAKYVNQKRYAVAIDCVVMGYEEQTLKILLIKRSFNPMKGHWSLMGGFVQPEESADQAADRILKELTGLEGVYLEQFKTFTAPDRDPQERTISIAYYALIDINQYKESLSQDYEAQWFPIREYPELIFDHNEIVTTARHKLRYKAASHAILFELLPQKFTMPLLQALFEDVYGAHFDKGNFSRKMLSTGLLIKLKEKDKSSSKKGAYYYRLDKKHYEQNVHKLVKMIPNPNDLL